MLWCACLKSHCSVCQFYCVSNSRKQVNNKLVQNVTYFVIFMWRLRYVGESHRTVKCRKRGFHLKAGVCSNLWADMNHNLCLWRTSGAPVPRLGHAVTPHCVLRHLGFKIRLPSSLFSPPWLVHADLPPVCIWAHHCLDVGVPAQHCFPTISVHSNRTARTIWGESAIMSFNVVTMQ